ncbi:MAG: tetratricopeptide repeat protein [Rhodospirillales bacterium]|nr:tetratricopeptide repeat protein [Rhodospirillales bacterium]
MRRILRSLPLLIALALAACGPSDAERAQQHLAKGNALMAEGRHDAAVDELKKAAELNRDSLDAHLQLGNAYRALKKYDQAAESYRTAKKIDRYVVTPHIASAAMQLELGHVDAAINELNHTIELAPRNLDVLVLLGQASMMPRPLPDGTKGVPKASVERAELNLERAVQIAPDNLPAHRELARAYELLGMKEKAVATWTKLRDLAQGKPEHARVATETAEALGRLK